MVLGNRRHTSQVQTKGGQQHRSYIIPDKDILEMGYPLDRQSCWYSTLTHLPQGRQLTGNRNYMASVLNCHRQYLVKHTGSPISLGIGNSYFQGRTGGLRQEGPVGTA